MKKLKSRNQSKVKSFIEENNIVPYSLIGATLFIFFMLLTMQFKTVNTTSEIYSGKRESELIEEIVDLKAKYSELEREYEESQKIVEEYKTNPAENSILISSMRDQINNLSVLAGTTELYGEGIIITLEDGEKVEEGSTRTDTLVHDSDILTVVNELMAAGAEAVSVNEERIISTSSIRCVGSVVQINSNKVAAPFVIKAIGNDQYLESAINIRNGVADLLRKLGIKVTVVRSGDIVIPKYSKNVTFQFAK